MVPECKKDTSEPSRNRKTVLTTHTVLTEEAQQHAGSHCRTDNTGHIRPHGVHEQVVFGIVLQTEILRDAGSHRHGRYTGITDKRINFLVFRQEQVEELDEKYA